MPVVKRGDGVKGIISGIKRMEIHDGEGLRTTVFFKGCPLRCIWCHNPESISFGRQVAKFDVKCAACGSCRGEVSEKTAAICPTEAITVFGREMSVEELLCELMPDKPFWDRSGGGVTLSGGECLAQPDFARLLCSALWERGVSVLIDTCGYVDRSAFDGVLPYVGGFLYDLKAVDTEVHRRCTGRDNGRIISNLRYLKSRGARLFIRYPLVMGYNDGECESIGRLLCDLGGVEEIKVLRYHSLSASRYSALGMECTLPDTVTAEEDVIAAVERLKAMGLNAVY